MPLTTTLNRIRAHHPCAGGWQKLLAYLGKTEVDDEPLAYSTIIDANGLDDALWACRAEPQYDNEWRLFVVWCGRQVQHLMADPRSIEALDVAEKFANGEATREELAAAWSAAEAAARDAARDAAQTAARDAAWAAAEAAAWDAAWDAARAAAAAARDAAWAAAAAAAWDAAWDAARAAAAAARDAARDAQAARFREVVG